MERLRSIDFSAGWQPPWEIAQREKYLYQGYGQIRRLVARKALRGVSLSDLRGLLKVLAEIPAPSPPLALRKKVKCR